MLYLVAFGPLLLYSNGTVSVDKRDDTVDGRPPGMNKTLYPTVFWLFAAKT